MRKFLALLGFCALLFAGRAWAETKSFTDEQLQSAGIRLEEQIKKDAAASAPRPLEQLRRDAQAALARSDFDGAMTASATALAANPKDAGLWLLYARAASGSDAKNYQRQAAATTAAYLAYQMATTKSDEAAALALLGGIYADRAMWRPSLDALRSSLELADNATIRARYEDERAKYGFRIRLQGRQRFGVAACLLSILRILGARPRRFHALCCRIGCGERRDLGR
jgi:tetratricopeptide (TPR) repeat protein